MFFTFGYLIHRYVLIDGTFMRDGHYSHSPVDVVNKSLGKKYM